MSVAAQCASVVGCGGLVALYVATSRTARLAGLVAWGAGLGVLGYTLLPDVSRPKLAAAAVGGADLLAACGGSPSAPPPTDAAATITITSSGLSPREVRVTRSARVQFVNDDTRQHAVSSDPVNTHRLSGGQ